ncbi:MAG: diguanylate cyclase [Halobacteria archaeon]|nr:diguanylate cyclase [Halobacteria archaeon]
MDNQMSNTPGNKQRLLIVDDSKVIRVTARKILQNHFETVEALDGNSAWEILSDEPPFSLVVSDLTMPGMDGFGLLEKIRGSHLPHVRDLPVIIITGANDSEATMQRATEAGATDFIGKPFDAVHLLARTQAHADAYSTEQTLTQETMTLEDQALVDPSSGLPNETAFMERGQELLAYSVRHESALALFFIDIDDFGEIFKQHGDTATMSSVKSVADVLSACIRQEDMAARIGSSRFALLLPGMSNDGIRNLADRIIHDVHARDLKINDTTVRLSVSIGVAAPELSAATSFESMLSSATGNLQEAARLGGNQAVHAQASQPAPAPEITYDSVEPDPADAMPEAVMEPLPDLELVGTGEDTAVKTPFAPSAIEEEETIVITVPDDYYSPDEHAEMTKAAMAAAAKEAAERGETDAETSASAGAGPRGGNRKRRRGLLSRLFPWFRRKD